MAFLVLLHTGHQDFGILVRPWQIWSTDSFHNCIYLWGIGQKLISQEGLVQQMGNILFKFLNSSVCHCDIIF